MAFGWIGGPRTPGGSPRVFGWVGGAEDPPEGGPSAFRMERRVGALLRPRGLRGLIGWVGGNRGPTGGSEGPSDGDGVAEDPPEGSLRAFRMVQRGPRTS